MWSSGKNATDFTDPWKSRRILGNRGNPWHFDIFFPHARVFISVGIEPRPVDEIKGSRRNASLSPRESKGSDPELPLCCPHNAGFDSSPGRLSAKPQPSAHPFLVCQFCKLMTNCDLLIFQELQVSNPV
jgi:hypothetical protein